MCWTSPLPSRSWLLGQRIRKTVKVPAETAEGARNDHPIWLRCCAVTLVTQNRLSFAVLQSVIIWCFIITATVVPAMPSA